MIVNDILWLIVIGIFVYSIFNDGRNNNSYLN